MPFRIMSVGTYYITIFMSEPVFLTEGVFTGAGDPGGKPYHLRRDSWDPVEKTRQMLSSNR